MNNNLLSNRFTRLAALILLMTAGSCSVFRPGTTSDGSGATQPERTAPAGKGSGDDRFLNTISTDNAGNADAAVPDDGATAGKSGKSERNRASDGSLYRPREKTPARPKAAENGSSTPLSVLQLKYSMLTNTPVEKLDNTKLLEFMDEWYGVPYRFGGTTKKGIDCSAFTLALMSDVYGVTSIPRMSRDQYAASEKISRKKLREGDLVFFHTYGKGKTVTHVGVYLYNNRFVHASVSGVQIDDLDGSYYSRHFVGAGRILE